MVVRYGRWAVGACDDVCYGGMPYYTTNNHTTNNDTRQHQPAHTRTPTTRCHRGRALQQGRRKGKRCQQLVRHATWYAIPPPTRAILTPGLSDFFLRFLLFGISTLGQFQLEIPEFLPDQSPVICEEMDDSNFDPNCQHEDYSIFRSWCLGNRCDDHAVKGYVKSFEEDGTVVWFTTEEQINLDISSLESWQIIRYTSEELQELDIMPEDCSYESEQDGTCGYGLFPPQP